VEHTRQARPDSGLGLQAKILKTFYLVPSSLLQVMTLEFLDASQILYEKTINLKLPGNEAYYTSILQLLVNMMLSRKLHYRKVLN